MQNKSWYLLEGEIEIKDIGIVDGTGKHPQRRGVDFWVLTLLQKGQRTLRSDGEEIRVSAHEFFLLPPHTALRRFPAFSEPLYDKDTPFVRLKPEQQHAGKGL